ncbi:MAG: hypothetical protein RLZ64_1650, partial [Pseudomonadota bacterium]
MANEQACCGQLIGNCLILPSVKPVPRRCIKWRDALLFASAIIRVLRIIVESL